jgi:hypothetical protein
LCRDLEKSLSERHGRGMVRARHGRGIVRARHGCGMSNVHQTRPHCVNQMGKTQSKPLAARQGRRTAWARNENGIVCVCELSLIVRTSGCSPIHPAKCSNSQQYHYK